MSSAVVSTPAALGRPFVFDDADAEVCPSSAAKKPARQESAAARVFQSAINNRKSAILSRVTPASQLEIRPAPEMVSSGVPAIDALTGGLPRGCLTEICGPASSGRTTLLLAALAAATRRGEFCAVVDASDALDPQSAAAAGVDLERLLWVRCGDDTLRKDSSTQSQRVTEKHGNQKDENQKSGTREAYPEPVEWGRISSAREAEFPAQHAFDFDQRGAKGTGSKENAWKEHPSRQSDHRLEQVLRATDLLLESGGFGLIVLDLGDLPPQSARRIPLTTWFRYRRAIEHTPTILLTIEQQAIAGSCSSLLLQLGTPNSEKSMMRSDQSESSRGAVAWDGLARQCRVAEGKKHKFRGDGTVPVDEEGDQLAGANDACGDLPIVRPAHAHLLTGLNITAELIRSRLDRKPARPIAFESATAWAG